MRPEVRKKRREAGFTLVELMVVIVIIGLLVTIVALNVLPSGDTARIQKAKADIAQIEGGLELYKLQNMTFPNTTQGLNALVTAPAGLTDPSRYQRGGYLKKLPNDPWGRPYLYASPGAHGEADQVEFGADHGFDHFAVGGVVRGLEHVLGIDRGRNVARQRPFKRAGKRRAVGAVDQDRLADQ